MYILSQIQTTNAVWMLLYVAWQIKHQLEYMLHVIVYNKHEWISEGMCKNTVQVFQLWKDGNKTACECDQCVTLHLPQDSYPVFIVI